jgi:hypothetical protein
MWLFAKIFLVVVVLGLAVQLGSVYYSTILMGGYFDNASLGSSIIVGVGAPIAIVAATFFLIRAIIRFDPKSLNDL